MGPVELVPPADPLTDHTMAPLAIPLTRALYCAVPPSLTCAGPFTETVCAFIPLWQAARKHNTDMSRCRPGRKRIDAPGGPTCMEIVDIIRR